MAERTFEERVNDLMVFQGQATVALGDKLPFVCLLVFKTGSSYVAQAGFAYVILLPQTPSA